MIPDTVENHPNAARNEMIWLHRFAQAIIANGGSLVLPADATEGVSKKDFISEVRVDGDRIKFTFNKKPTQ